MDTLSRSVSSSFKVPGLCSTSREFRHFTTPTASHHLPPARPHISSFSRPNSVSSRPTSTRNNFITSPLFSSSQTKTPQNPPIIHRKATIGYAAALVDVARCNNTLEALGRDVRRLVKLLNSAQIRAVMSDTSVEEEEKGRAVKKVAENGKFDRHLVVLLKMLVDKGKLGMLGKVLDEFGAIYDELCGIRSTVVLVSSAVEMEEAQLFGFAKNVQ
ncbi:hypothetical protein U1Q18_003463 [Sarracenia purpurea var. burkii]